MPDYLGDISFNESKFLKKKELCLSEICQQLPLNILPGYASFQSYFGLLFIYGLLGKLWSLIQSLSHSQYCRKSDDKQNSKFYNFYAYAILKAETRQAIGFWL